MSTKLIAADASAGTILDPSVGDGTLVIQTGAAGAKVDALTLGTTGNGALLGTLTQAGIATPRMVLATAQNATGGTYIDFTGIPSWAKRITVMLNGVSASGTAELLLQIGSGTIDTSSTYSGGVVNHNGTSGQATTTGAILTYSGSGSFVYVGQVVLVHMGSNLWSMCGLTQATNSGGAGARVAVAKSLSGALDRIRLTTTNGTDTFDAGSVNILYEG